MTLRAQTPALALCGALAAIVVAFPFVPADRLPPQAAARWTEIADDQNRALHLMGRTFNFDKTTANTDPTRPFAQTVAVRRGATITVSGWALDPGSLVAAKGIAFRVDHGPWSRGRYGVARPDIPAVFSLPDAATNCGFVVELETARIVRGRHVVQIGTVAVEGAIRPLTLPIHVLIT